MDTQTPEPKTAIIIIYGLVSIFALVVVITAMAFYFGTVRDRVIRQQVEMAPATELAQVRAEENEKLYKYAYIDVEQGLVRVPIERAMVLEANDPWRSNIELPEQPVPPTTPTQSTTQTTTLNVGAGGEG